MVPDLTSLKLKWWQYLIVAVVAMGIDVIAHVNALGFSADSSAVSAVAIPIASAALIAMSALPAVQNAKAAVEANHSALSEVAQTVVKIDQQTNGVLDQKIKDATKAALVEHLNSTADKQDVADIKSVVADSSATVVSALDHTTIVPGA